MDADADVLRFRDYPEIISVLIYSWVACDYTKILVAATVMHYTFCVLTCNQEYISTDIISG